MYSSYKVSCRCRVEPTQTSNDVKVQKSNTAANGPEAPESVDNDGGKNTIVFIKDSQQPCIMSDIKTGVQEVANAKVNVMQNDDVENTVNNCWSKIEEQRRRELSNRNEKSLTNNGQLKGWKTIRVFVSSTFTDMHSEREILVKKVNQWKVDG